MSGGVDSGVAAALLVERGYEVVGVYLDFGIKACPQRQQPARYCKQSVAGGAGLRGGRGLKGLKEGRDAAQETAERLGISFCVKDYSKDFKKIVVDYFLAEYAAGRTPNPCVVCNQFIKFGKLLDYARALGCDYLATGHYARISSSAAPSGPRKLHSINVPLADPLVADASSDVPVRRLLKGIDESKDQSYFLWILTQEKLARILFPIGELRKPEVRKIARTKNLLVSDRSESFEVCFVQDRDYRDFLKRHLPEAIEPGEVVNTKGQIIGKHFGLPLYTIGQRKGFKVQSAVPLYVVGKDLEKNQLVVGRGGESERQKFAVGGVNWIKGEEACLPAGRGVKCEVRTRYQGPLLNAKISSINAKTIVELDEAVRGITPGQSAVFYADNEVLGGGIIED